MGEALCMCSDGKYVLWLEGNYSVILLCDDMAMQASKNNVSINHRVCNVWWQWRGWAAVTGGREEQIT